MDEMFNRGSIVNFFKDAGFKAFWFSNQEASSGYISAVASDSDMVAFNETGDDMDLLKLLSGALSDPYRKKVIFMHLSGDHASYEKNYPADFNFWNISSDLYNRKIDAYDNSIRYRDFVLSQYIKRLMEESGVSYLVYFPDHGEDAIGPDSCFCHSSSIASNNMFEIPFIVWLSPEYRNLRREFVSKFDLKRGFNTQHFIHAAIDLSGLYNSSIDLKKSLFSTFYENPKKLIIKSP
jgi:heptose-I-phosphate ethanolaminephosphotransferase